MNLLEKLSRKKCDGEITASYIRKHLSETAYENYLHCGDHLVTLEDQERIKKKLEIGFFCKQRMCPGCAWRWSLATSVCVSSICQAAADRNRKIMIMVTLTVPNVPGEQLRDAIRSVNTAWDKLMRRKRYEIWKDHIRKLEVTYNAERDDYHPHLHCIVLISPGYFDTKKKKYISRDKLLADWKSVTGIDTITQVDIRRCRDKGESSAILEISKYCAKSKDYAQSEHVFDVFYKALYRMRGMTYSGLCKQLRAEYLAKNLDEYLERDMTKYVYRVVYRWGKTGQYEEKEIKPYDAAEDETVEIHVDPEWQNFIE